MFGFGKKDQQNQDENSTENEEMYVLNPEETEEFFSEYKQSEAYEIYQSIKNGTYQQKYGDRQ